MNEVEFFINKDGVQSGPFPEDVVRSRLQSGTLGPDDLAWKEGMAEWMPISQVLEATPKPSAPVQKSSVEEEKFSSLGELRKGLDEVSPLFPHIAVMIFIPLIALLLLGGIARSYDSGYARWEPKPIARTALQVALALTGLVSLASRLRVAPYVAGGSLLGVYAVGWILSTTYNMGDESGMYGPPRVDGYVSMAFWLGLIAVGMAWWAQREHGAFDRPLEISRIPGWTLEGLRGLLAKDRHAWMRVAGGLGIVFGSLALNFLIFKLFGFVSKGLVVAPAGLGMMVFISGLSVSAANRDG